MKTEHKQSKPCSDSNGTFVAGLFYTFVSLTGAAFLLRIFGLDCLSSSLELEEPSPFAQEVIKASLKAFELTFVYKILTRKRFVLCGTISVIQSFLVGFIPVGGYQSISDAILMVVIPLVFRKDKWWSILDTVFLYTLMCIYGSLSLIGKFGELDSSQVYSFYEAILGMMDYKLFIVTLYLFIKCKGGIRLWKTRRKLLQP